MVTTAQHFSLIKGRTDKGVGVISALDATVCHHSWNTLLKRVLRLVLFSYLISINAFQNALHFGAPVWQTLPAAMRLSYAFSFPSSAVKIAPEPGGAVGLSTDVDYPNYDKLSSAEIRPKPNKFPSIDTVTPRSTKGLSV